ncbi:B12-binding domain-containing radical SAM protein [Desulfospira joergensenii]|uniref:B12-binding domain-containing radical SAM protein n=1 Tax=Desulfospira joergensenii TaxID=53329 RepID=UPI0003B47979|nr:B12-binding domain-containing radical SAM protein [Desulfospira joergensenii]
MKLLLVQVPTSHLGAGEKVYPLGLSRLSARVPEKIEKQGLDMNLSPDPWARLQEVIEDFTPHMVALSFRNLDPLAGHQASYLSSLKTAARLVRALVPRAVILAGGPAFSLFGKRLMQEVTEIDLGLIGEGESAFSLFLSDPSRPDRVPGLIRRDREKLILNPPGPGISMDEIPKPDTKTFLPLDYMKGNAYVAAMGIEGKRGCDLHCAYCLYPFLGGTCLRLRSPGKIVDEMEMLKNKFKINLFHFTDGVVNRPRDHFEALCRELIRRNLNIAWTGFFREDSLGTRNLELAMESGLAAVYFSGDALTARGLKLLNKRMEIKDILDAARLTSDKGILTMCHFLVNLPGEDGKSVEEAGQNLDRLLEIHARAGNLGAVIFNHVRLYPGAPLTRRLLRNKNLDPDTDLLYPVFHNPVEFSHVLHEFEARCHAAGVFSRLGLAPDNNINDQEIIR